MQLQAAVHDFLQHFRRQRLYHRNFARAWLAGFGEFSRMIGQRTGGRGLGREHCELEPYRLLIPQRAAECLAAFHIIGGEFDRLCGLTGADAADADALVLEGFHDAVEAAVLLAEQILRGDSHILEGDLGGIRAKPAVLVEFCDRDAWRRPRDDEQ